MSLTVEELITSLRRCRSDKDQRCTEHLYGYLCRNNLDSHPVLGNYLVPALVECGNLKVALRVFDMIPCRSESSWNSLILGYIDEGDPEKALTLYQRMQRERMQPNNYIYNSFLIACSKLKDLAQAHALHREIILDGSLEDDLLVGNALMDVYGKCGMLIDSHDVFSKLHSRDIVSWNVMISTYAEFGLAHQIMNSLGQMQYEGVSPNRVTFLSSLKACSLVGARLGGQVLCAEVTKRGLESDVSIGSTLIDMYAKCDLMVDAQNIFGRLSNRNLVSWNALIGGYAEHGHWEEALTCFEQSRSDGMPPDRVTFIASVKAACSIGDMDKGQEIYAEIVKRGLDVDSSVGTSLINMYVTCSLLEEAQYSFKRLYVRDRASWATLMSGYAENGLTDEVLEFYKQMQDEGVSATGDIFACCMKACSVSLTLEGGQEVYTEMTKLGLERHLFAGSATVDMYAKCGSFVDAQKVFDKLRDRDVGLWNVMIKAYGENHQSEMAVESFEDMRAQGVKPDAITFISVLAACSYGSLVLKGQEFFSLMREEYGINPSLDHLTCMVDLLARSGHVDKAEKFAKAMQCYYSTEVLRALLTGARIHGEADVGRQCFQQLMLVNQDDATAYLLMTDTYANAGICTDAKKIEEMRVQMEDLNWEFGSCMPPKPRRRLARRSEDTAVDFLPNLPADCPCCKSVQPRG